jgi:hypothetical protein
MLLALGGDAQAEREGRQLAPANQESLEEPKAQWPDRLTEQRKQLKKER